MKKLMGFLKDEDGVTMVEYALMAALIAVAVILIVTNLGTSVGDIFKTIGDELDAAS